MRSPEESLVCYQWGRDVTCSRDCYTHMQFTEDMLQLLSLAEKWKIRQEKLCQQGLQFVSPHYTGGLNWESFWSIPTLKTFPLLLERSSSFLILPFYFFSFPLLTLMTESFTQKNVLLLKILLVQRVVMLLLPWFSCVYTRHCKYAKLK